MDRNEQASDARQANEPQKSQYERDSETLRLGNIIEIAVANKSGSVSDYMKHWESRALRAESELESLRAGAVRSGAPPQETLLRKLLCEHCVAEHVSNTQSISCYCDCHSSVRDEQQYETTRAAILSALRALHETTTEAK